MEHQPAIYLDNLVLFVTFVEFSFSNGSRPTILSMTKMSLLRLFLMFDS